MIDTLNRVNVEVCATSINSALAADRAGANRIELCDNISEGGTTPSAGMIKACIDQLTLETWVMIRPRGGDFLYNEFEFEVMKRDIELAKALGCNGIVTGMLNSDGSVDVKRMKELVDLADPIKVAFHRAIDMSSDPFAAIDELADIGVVRILTSGMKNKVIDGIELINRLYKYADGRLEIMAGSGINPLNIQSILENSNINAVHLTGSSLNHGGMQYKPSTVVLNSIGHEYDFMTKETDEEIIRKVVLSCKK